MQITVYTVSHVEVGIVAQHVQSEHSTENYIEILINDCEGIDFINDQDYTLDIRTHSV